MAQRYRDPRGDSGIQSFEAGDAWIVVQFKDGNRYLYDGSAPGARHVAEMIRLARSGEGLNTYINQHVRKNYARALA